MIRLPCPKCAARLSVDPSKAGVLAKCPACGERIRVPAAPPSTAIGPLPAAPPTAPKAPASLGELPDLDDIKLLGDDDPPPPAPKPAAAAHRPAPQPARKSPPVPARQAPDLSGFEVIEDKPAPPPKRKPEPTAAKPAPKRRPAEEPAEAFDVVEEIEEAEVLDAVELVEDDTPPARRRPRPAPGPGAYTEAPVRRRPAIAGHDEDDDRPRRGVRDDEDEDDRPRRRPQGRRAGKGGVAPALFVALGVAGVLWIALTPLAFYFEYAAMGMIAVGFFPAVAGRLWLARIMHRETEWIYRIIPFYEFYFVLTRLGKTFAPLVLWFCGLCFLLSGIIAMAVHNVHERRAGGGGGGAGSVATARDAREADARCEKLLAGANRKEARAWVATLPNNLLAGVFSSQVEAAYQSGAAEVVAANIHIDGDGNPAADLVLALPGDPAARKRVFAWRRANDFGEQDFGQKYILLDSE